MSDAWRVASNNAAEGDLMPCMQANTWTRPLLTALPLLWRLLQCLRRYRDGGDKWQIANACKYGSGICTSLLSLLRQGSPSAFVYGIWICSAIFSAGFAYVWDLTKDWGLMQSKHGFLRAKTIYPHYFYYYAIVSNFVLRLSWTLSISPDILSSFGGQNVLGTIVAALEIVRRSTWNIFRLENEHL